jgi:hypothetical protein
MPHKEMMVNAWTKVSLDERIHELNIAKAEALGNLLGIIDIVMLAEEYPEVFCISQKLHRLRQARKAYDAACAAYLDARMTAT